MSALADLLAPKVPATAQPGAAAAPVPPQLRGGSLELPAKVERKLSSPGTESEPVADPNVCAFCQTVVNSERPGYHEMLAMNEVKLHPACLVGYKQQNKSARRRVPPDQAAPPSLGESTDSLRNSIATVAPVAAPGSPASVRRSQLLRRYDSSEPMAALAAGWPRYASEGRIPSPTQLALADDVAVKTALTCGRLKLTVVETYDEVESKTEWFILRAAVVDDSEASTASWAVPRTHAHLVQLHKALATAARIPELPPLRSGRADETPSSRMTALNQWLTLLDRSNPTMFTTSLALARFVDPFDKPTFFGLRIIAPQREGWMEVWSGKARAQRLYCVLKGDLFCFDREMQVKYLHKSVETPPKTK
jgi:hypothetical protein